MPYQGIVIGDIAGIITLGVINVSGVLRISQSRDNYTATSADIKILYWKAQQRGIGVRIVAVPTQMSRCRQIAPYLMNPQPHRRAE